MITTLKQMTDDQLVDYVLAALKLMTCHRRQHGARRVVSPYRLRLGQATCTYRRRNPGDRYADARFRRMVVDTQRARIEAKLEART